MKNPSRRTFVITAGGIAAAGLAQAQHAGSLTALQVIERIKQNVGVPWKEQTVDRLVAGRPDVLVNGIATTMMATLDVLQRSAASGKNLVITHEPTFYLHQDTGEGLASDEVYHFKTGFVHAHNMAVFHFHDHWHAHHPDGIAFGMARELGWEKNLDSNSDRQFTFSATSLADFAKDVQSRLRIRTMRVIGDPKLRVRRITASWGYVGREHGIELLAKPDVDVLVCGETREWEVVEYAQDAIAAGRKKALIILGHVVSEQAGMKYCAEWLKGFVTEVPIEFVPAREPFWAPDLPVA